MSDCTRSSNSLLRRLRQCHDDILRQIDHATEPKETIYRDAADEIERLQRQVETLSAELAKWVSEAQREKLRAADEPGDCNQCDELIGERDRAQDALQETHIALGGDGEWVGRSPPQPAPDSGDLHLDVPELARERMAELERLRASSPPPVARWRCVSYWLQRQVSGKLYVAARHYAYEGFVILGIFSNRDAAQAVCDKDKPRGDGDGYSIEEFTLDVESSEE